MVLADARAVSDRCSRFWRRLSVVFLCLTVAGAERAQAQQSLFNAPSGEITPAGHVFVQEQASLEHGYGDSNRTYLGAGSRGGVSLGCEIPLIGERLMLMGDAVIGTNTTSVAVLGVQSMLDRHARFQLAAGAQPPMPWTNNAHGCVLEFTLRPIGNAAVR